MNKHRWLDVAELIDGYRVIPRAFFAACFVLVVELTWFLLHWYTGLAKDERGPETSGFASIVYITSFGFMKLVYDTYSKNGRDWNVPRTTTQTSTVTTSTGKPADFPLIDDGSHPQVPRDAT